MRRCAEILPLNDVCGGVESLRPLTIGLRRSAACEAPSGGADETCAGQDAEDADLLEVGQRAQAASAAGAAGTGGRR